MSMKLMSRVWDMELSQGRKFLLLKLCDYANDDGLCYPGQATLQKQCSMGKTTVTEHLNWLEKVGILTRERRQKGGQRSSDLYHINLDNFTSEGSDSECSKSEGSESERSDSDIAKVQILNSEGSDSEPSFKEEPSENHQIEPSDNTHATKKINKRVTLSKSERALLEEHGITGQLANDFLIVRKAKHAPLTTTALNGILREAQKAGVTLLQAITICVERGWQGFNADWLLKDRNQHQQHSSIKNIPVHTQGGSFLAKDIF